MSASAANVIDSVKRDLPDEEVTQAEFARRVGCSKQNISKLVRAGKISRNKNGKLNFLQALAEYDANTDDSHHEKLKRTGKSPAVGSTDPDQAGNGSAPPPDAPVSDYKLHRAKREAANAQLQQLKADELAGKLIAADQVERDAYNLARGLRDAILSVPDRVAAILAAEQDARRVSEILHEEIEKALNGLIDAASKDHR